MTNLIIPNGSETHFTSLEAACPLTNKVIMEPDHLADTELLRLAFGHPMQVTSWCRSDEYLRDLINRGYPASPNSFHLMKNKKYGTKTCALDIARPQGPLLAKLVKHAITLNWSLGIAKTFIHLDQRSKYTNLPQTIYTY